MTSFSLGPFAFSMARPKPFTLKKGETKILSFWSWKKFGWRQKAIMLCPDGNITVEII